MVVSKMRLLALQKGLKVSASAWELSEQHIGIGDYDDLKKHEPRLNLGIRSLGFMMEEEHEHEQE